jgi:hypothetical protein
MVPVGVPEAVIDPDPVPDGDTETDGETVLLTEMDTELELELDVDEEAVGFPADAEMVIDPEVELARGNPVGHSIRTTRFSPIEAIRRLTEVKLKKTPYGWMVVASTGVLKVQVVRSGCPITEEAAAPACWIPIVL